MPINASIAWRACVSDASLTWMFHVATGSVAPPPPPPPPPEGAEAAATDDDAEPEDTPTVKSSMFTPPVSKYNVSCCVPAPSVTGVEMTVQLCQPPVAGTPTLFQTLLPLLNPTWMEAPFGDATRSQTMYEPADGTFTV